VGPTPTPSQGLLSAWASILLAHLLIPIISDDDANVKRFGKNKKIKIFKKSLDKIAGVMV
jgi:hypothetical protein